ncbi:MAG: TetR/AcrR family transcriptional regulator [Desulfosarcinaceae bacterium]|jgi:AcrR family transcriptional regulator
MKISQEQKAENRRKIIEAAVELIGESGLKAATMRQIARQAGVGDATIYNYFPTKEAILYGYYEDHMRTCIEALKAVPDFQRFSLQEQVQTLFDTSQSLYLPDREFVAHTFRRTFLAGSGDWTRLKPIRAIFLAAIGDMLDAAAEVGEIPDQVFEDLIGQFFMEAYLGVIVYWLADTSDGFSNTSVLVDRGLDLACALIKAGIANKLFDMALFLFKTHIVARMEALAAHAPFGASGKRKRRFMEAFDE